MSVSQKVTYLPPIARILDRLVFISLLITLVLTAIPYGTVQPWWIAAFECGVFLIAMLAVIETTISKRWQFELSLAVPLVAIILYALVQSLPLFTGPPPLSPRTALSADPYNTRLFAIELTALGLVMMLLLHYTNTKRRLRVLMYVVICIGAGSAMFGILRQGLQHGTGFLLPALPLGGRSFGQFINHNHFALLLEMSLGLTLGLIVAEAGRYRRVAILAATAGLMWVAIVYSNSRGGIVASLCQLLFLGVILDPVRHLDRDNVEAGGKRFQKIAGGLVVRALFIICLIAVFIYGVGWIGGEPVVSNFQLAAADFTQQKMENNANTSRREIWSATWRLIKDHPVAGFGFGAYWIGITRYHHASGEITPQQAHNDYLELAADGGLVGLGLLGWFATVFIVKARRRLHSSDRYFRTASLGALTGIFGVAVHSFVDFGLHLTINALILFVLITIVVQNPGLHRPIEPGALRT